MPSSGSEGRSVTIFVNWQTTPRIIFFYSTSFRLEWKNTVKNYKFKMDTLKNKASFLCVALSNYKKYFPSGVGRGHIQITPDLKSVGTSD